MGCMTNSQQQLKTVYICGRTSEKGRGARKPSGRLSLIAAAMLLRVLDGAAAGAGACVPVHCSQFNDFCPVAECGKSSGYIAIRPALGCAAASVRVSSSPHAQI
jgi:hypothetical protein